MKSKSCFLVSANSSITFLTWGIPHQRPKLLQDRQVLPRATCASFQGSFCLSLVSLVVSVLPLCLLFFLLSLCFPPGTHLLGDFAKASLCSGLSLQLPSITITLQASAFCCPSRRRSLPLLPAATPLSEICLLILKYCHSTFPAAQIN